MYNLQKNNYHQKPKSSTIYTPPEISQFIWELLKDKFPPESLVLDPCCGKGNLLLPWKEAGYPTWGIDIDPNSNADAKTDFFSCKPYESEWNDEANLVLCHPPFNGYGNKLGSEVWLDKIIELFGKEVPIVLFTPVKFRTEEKRWQKFGKWPAISSIINLPHDIFPEVRFHSEILIFNIKGLKGHYFFK